MLTFIYPIASPAIHTETTFTITPIDESSFEMIMGQTLTVPDISVPLSTAVQEISRSEMPTIPFIQSIWKTKEGFCVVRKPDFIVIADGSRSMTRTECFRPYGI